MTACATADDGLAFVREHGVVLASARGQAPSLAEAIAGEAIRGSWWAHPRGRRIYAVLTAVGESPEVLVCRLVDGKITFVHRRLWPSLARVADRFAPERLARVRQEHTASGRHATHEVPFPQWVPEAVLEEADRLGEAEALATMSAWLSPAAPLRPEA